MIPPLVNHFGKITAWSLIYFLNYAQFDISTQSQILVLTLYVYLENLVWIDYLFCLDIRGPRKDKSNLNEVFNLSLIFVKVWGIIWNQTFILKSNSM